MITYNQTSSAEVSATTVLDLRVEHRRDSLGIGEARPRLSWRVTASGTWRQTAYEIEARHADGALRGDTGKVESEQSVLVSWPFEPLVSRERLEVRVRVWGSSDHPSDWSAPCRVEVGLLHAEDWHARFITADREEDVTQPQPAPIFRHEFDARPGVARARLYATALGVYEAEINGKVVGDHVLDPGWTSYHHRLRYQTFDVTDLIREGRNAIGAFVGDGWYRGRLGWGGGRRNVYGDRLALLAQLEIEYADGTTDRIVSDDSWRAATGPILTSDLYDGEVYDARRERPGWSEPGYDARAWTGVGLVDRDLATLVAPLGPPVRRTALISPVAITTSPTGRTIVDFGQNLVGRIRLTARGTAGQTITLRHAEVLENGEICTRPLREAKATDSYTLRGGGVETWEPRFTFHGFRYAEVEGWPGALRPDDLVAVVCHSDLDRTGWFECSDPLINRLHENVVWSMRGNFLDLPTDCPQRDERLGWTGDIQVFAPTASFLYDVAGFLSSWLADLAADQDASGAVPFIVPGIPTSERPYVGAAAWGDAAVIVPWVLYQRFGDQGILARQFASMRAWVDYVARLAGERHLWDEGFQFGDWLDPAAPPDRPGDARTDRYLVATAYFARSTELVGRAARVLDHSDLARQYLALAARVRRAFSDEYVTPNGRVVSDTATAYALALQFALLPAPEQRRHAAERLVRLVRDSGYRVSTGFVGTPLICDALCDVGAYDAAFRLLTQRACPSWLYPVTMGATTVWERWDSMLPDGAVNPGQMTSFNHYALGAVADWLHRAVAGLAPAAPGYRRIEIRPHVGGGLTSAWARHLTPYGVAESGWKIDGGAIEVRASIPPCTTATVVLPVSEVAPVEVGPGSHRWSYPVRRPPRPVRGVDSKIGDLYEDEAAWTALTAALPDLKNLETALAFRGSTSLRQVLAARPESAAAIALVEGVLADLER